MKKKSLKQKAMALFMALSLCVTSVPTSAFASESGTGAETSETAAITAVSEEAAAEKTETESETETEAGSTADAGEGNNAAAGSEEDAGSEGASGSESGEGASAGTNANTGGAVGNSIGTESNAETNAEANAETNAETDPEGTIGMGSGAETCVHGNTAGDCVTCVQELIEALPATTDLDGMDEDSLNAVYNQMQAVYSAYNALSAENQSSVNTARLTALSAYFEAQSSGGLGSVGAEESEKVVNEGVVIKIVSKEDTVKTGEYHQVTIKSSYSATNDGDKATVRIYMQDVYGNMNTVAEPMGMLDDKIEYTSENNTKLSVTLTHGYEYDGNGTAVAEYLEYVLPAGTSVEMELEFKVANGINGPLETLVLTPEVTHEAGDGSNDEISGPVTLKWTSEFKWTDLKKSADIDEAKISKDGILSEDIVYSYSDVMNPDASGVIWTDSVEITETISLPEGLTFSDGLTLGDDGIYLDTERLISVELPQDYTLSDYVMNDDKNLITFKITVANDNRDREGVLTADFDAMKYLQITLKQGSTTASLLVLGAINLDGYNLITNAVEVKYVPYENRTDPITLSSDCEVNIVYEEEDSTVKKTASTTSTKEGSSVTYSATIENSTSESIAYEFYDIMDNGIGLSEAERESLINQGYTVGYVDLLYSNEDMRCTIDENSTKVFSSSDYAEVSEGLNENAFVLVDLEIEDDGKYQTGSYSLTGYILTFDDSWNYSNYYGSTKEISFADAEVVNGKRTVTVKLDFTDINTSDAAFCYICDLGFSVVKSEVENDSSVTVTKVLLYNGVEEASTDAELAAENEETVLYTHTPDSSYNTVMTTTGGETLYSVSDIVTSFGTDPDTYYWDSHDIYTVYPGIAAADLSEADDAVITVDVRNLYGYSRSFNEIILVVWMMDYN